MKSTEFNDLQVYSAKLAEREKVARGKVFPQNVQIKVDKKDSLKIQLREFLKGIFFEYFLM